VSGRPGRGVGSWELVAAVQGGDRDAFGELYSRYREMVSRYVQWRVRDRELVEDLTAETFARALARVDSLSYQGRDVGAWLVTIARHLVLDHAKRSATRREVHRAVLPDTVDDCDGPEELALAALDRDAVAVALTQLCADQRECIRLRFELELPSRRAGVEMGRSVLAVNALRHRAVRTLAPLLAPVVGEVA
jgi:RNA polymerase sigma-70 factor, ECF subfamily